MVAQYLGDGVLAYFGYPAAHEDDAERAVRAGLAIIDRIAVAVAGVALQVRIGIASGVVVIGDLVHEGMTQEHAAIGETTNLAARLQAIAQPNTVVIAPATHRLVSGHYEYRDLGRHTLKGFAEPLHVRQVLGLSGIESRFDALHQSGVAPLLGRDEELKLLIRRWAQAIGEGHVILVTGEAGIGKSRLLKALRDFLSTETHTPLSYFCAPTYKDTALYPFIGQLTRAAGIERTDQDERKLTKLEALIGSSSGDIAGDMPLLAALLSIPGGERHPLPSVSPQRRKKRTFDVLLRLLKQLAAKQPLLMVIEDLHWIDPTSLELLSLVIHQIQRNRILLIATARPEFKPSWPNHLHISTVSLSRLDHAAARALIEGVTQGKPIPSEILDQILTRTDGVPLFVEELTKTVLESGLLREAAGGYELTGALPPLGIPSTLHASLLARLDRLSSVKDVAQIGAAIGREFSYGLIAAVASLSENDLNAALAQLVDAELIFQRGVPPDLSYQFKHALVQDAAYSSLIRSRRQQLHAAIGRAIESEFPEVAATEPELLAYHYSEAHLPEPAVKYWLEAGRRASQRSADKEAVVQLERGLSLLKLLPESISRDRLELELQLTMGTPLVAMRGFTNPDFGAACERATHLAEKLDDAPQLFASLYAQFSYAMTTGKTRKALEFAERCQALGVARADRIMQLLAYRARGNVLLQLGKLASARDELARVFDLYDPVSDRLLALRYIVDPFVAASVHSSTTLLIMGFPDQAKKMQDQARKRATELKHINSIGQFHLFAGAELEQHMGNTAKLLDHARALSTLAAEHGVSAWGTHSAALEGWAIAKNGNTANGIATMGKRHCRPRRARYGVSCAAFCVSAGRAICTDW